MPQQLLFRLNPRKPMLQSMCFVLLSVCCSRGSCTSCGQQKVNSPVRGGIQSTKSQPTASYCAFSRFHFTAVNYAEIEASFTSTNKPVTRYDVTYVDSIDRLYALGMSPLFWLPVCSLERQRKLFFSTIMIDLCLVVEDMKNVSILYARRALLDVVEQHRFIPNLIGINCLS